MNKILKQNFLSVLLFLGFTNQAQACVDGLSLRGHFLMPAGLSLILACFGFFSYSLCKYLDFSLNTKNPGKKSKSQIIERTKRDGRVFIALSLILFWAVFIPVTILDYKNILTELTPKKPGEVTRVSFVSIEFFNF